MASERQGHNHSRIHLYLHLHSQATTTVELIVAGPLAHPPHEKEAKRALHGGQAHGRRTSFDADDTTACAGPLPTFREMKQTDEVLVGSTDK